MVDPISLTGLALATGAGFLGSKALDSSSSSPTPQAAPAPAPTPPPAAAAPAQQPGVKAAPQGQQPTFLGAAAVPQQSGQKTLLGQ
jgi:hypothetical protein